MKKLVILSLVAGALAFNSQAAKVYWGFSDMVSATAYTGTEANFSGSGWTANLMLADDWDNTAASLSKAIESIANTAWAKNVYDGTKAQFQATKHGVVSDNKSLTVDKQSEFVVVLSDGNNYWASDKIKATVYADDYKLTTYESVYPSFSGANGIKQSAVGSFSVPEPTSAMLLLLGVAGMALRRRRA